MRYATGSIIPLGDGLTGKTVLTQFLVNYPLDDKERQTLLDNSTKSLNIEMEYRSSTISIIGESIKITLQYYVFPGQRQKVSDIAPTFDEILAIFDFLPAIQNVSVLMLLYDTTRLESLKSLESWLQVALTKQWVGDRTKIILVSNKIDLQAPDEFFVAQIREGIKQIILNAGHLIAAERIESFSTSSVTGAGVLELKTTIENWIAEYGVSLKRE